MTNRERFLAVAGFEQPDYVPIFGCPGAPGMSGGALKWTHRRLVEQGMPAWVGGSYEDWVCRDPESWHRYWGTAEPIQPGFNLAVGAPGIQKTTRIENGFEIEEYECGAVIRQIPDNADHYSMPEFIRYSVRDRASWEFWRDRMTPRAKMPPEEMEARCRALDGRTEALFVPCYGGYGPVRSLMGPEALSYAFYDDPELVHDMVDWFTQFAKEYVFPLIERLRPEAVYMGEDLCYNHGMLLSPAQFDAFCGPHYREILGCAQAAGVPVRAVDSDGNVMQFVDVAVKYGLNCLYPFEVKAGNDLFALRQKHPRFICVGWLEKEIVNEGNEAMIGPELCRKVPPLLAQRGYFPNGDHGIQPGVTHDGMCRFFTLLHELCGNPEGEFPRCSQ
ncbi:hypothetical protein HQ590_04705 [bacterium]|nr:hypothetical protein [bacterium]